MKRTAMLLIALAVAFSALADEQKPQAESSTAYNTSREMRSQVFQLHHRDPRTIANSIALLGSGFQGAGLDVNYDLDTITVRDFPENLATIGEAITRLDVPAPPVPDIELHLYVLVGSTGAAQGSSDLPPELSDVVPQLRSTLRYSNYALMTAAVHRTRSGERVEGSGVAQDKLLGFNAPTGSPVLYSYTLRRVDLQAGDDRQAIDIRDFRFGMRVPIVTGTTTQYQNVGFDTPLTIRDGEKVVVGTTSMGDKAIIVVVIATVGKPGA